ncbi:hypothetical protein LTR78_000346 [Recurvomyces mirabilis]|uniref:DUF4604 domain-containing protein n=1 Tax=Recurvomyces mirabilis TaxID=574656 RepID=A0AAE1C6H1_9PEZI|nr:hypothetical protein LTR78_000346 [Recurvomyces mirabilis]KAK5162001.1 hypothetical protein LTS14_000347 [Recurvomyces mirabilis]
MAGKIKAKDLSYDSSLPPFLQRLHDQKAGRGDQDLHERQLARPKRDKNADEDDGPTVVDESGDVVSKDELEKLNADAIGGDSPGEDVGGSVSGDLGKGDGGDGVEEVRASGALPVDGGKKDDAKVSTGLGARKRKAGKVVGEEKDIDAPCDDGPTSKNKATSKSKKKKVKPVKLAFDHGDEG